MKITINITKSEAEHIEYPHSFHDECEPVCILLRKLQKEIMKKKGAGK